MSGLQEIGFAGTVDDECLIAFFASLSTAEMPYSTAAGDLEYKTRWLFSLRDLRVEGDGYGLATIRCVAAKLGTGFAPDLQLLSFNGDADRRQLCDEGARALGAAFATGNLRHLRHLDLQNSSMTSAGLVAIANGLDAASLLDMSSLATLNILDSAVGDEGVERLAAVSHAHRITYFECRRTLVSVAGAKLLLSAGIRVDHDRTGWTGHLRAELQSFHGRALPGERRAGDGRY